MGERPLLPDRMTTWIRRQPSNSVYAQEADIKILICSPRIVPCDRRMENASITYAEGLQNEDNPAWQ